MLSVNPRRRLMSKDFLMVATLMAFAVTAMASCIGMASRVDLGLDEVETVLLNGTVAEAEEAIIRWQSRNSNFWLLSQF